MSGIDDAYAILNTGKRLTSGAASASTTLPTLLDGRVPYYIRVVCEGSGNANIKLGGASVAATTADVLVIANEPLILKPCGATHIAYIQNSAGAVINVAPIEA